MITRVLDLNNIKVKKVKNIEDNKHFWKIKKGLWRLKKSEQSKYEY